MFLGNIGLVVKSKQSEESKTQSEIYKKRMLVIVLCLVIAIGGLISPLSVYAQGEVKTVRVGWHEAPYFIEDQYGRWSGYSYEYQCKVAAYTGWNYEYVFGTWSELMQMLLDGKIDMFSNLSYTEERAQKILYSSIPMGTEAYYVFVSPSNTEITSEDYMTLSGKRVGVTKGSFQKEAFLSWAADHGIEVDLVEMSCTDEESIRLLGKEFDAFVSVDVYGNPEWATPVCKIGSSDFYFAVSRDRQDLLIELEAAMNRIQDENKYYNEQLHDKYLANTETDRYLSAREQNWLDEHGKTIRVAYQDNYLAFCASDSETGELTGALKDFLAYASTALEGNEINFKAVSYPTAGAAMDALKNGEVDCVFPANLTSYDSEILGVVMTPALMTTEMDAVVRASEQKEFLRKANVSVAVNEGNTNYDMFLADHYPNWQRLYYPDTPTGLDAVAEGEADCVIISNYRYSNISKQCESLRLATVYTGVNMDYCFAVLRGQTELYSILARLTKLVPDATVHTALTYYSTEDVKTTFFDVIEDNLHIIIIVVAVVLMVIIMLLLCTIYLDRKARKEEYLVRDLNRRVNVDALTSVRNKGAFNDYIRNLQDKLDSGESLEFAIGMLDCDNLKHINDSHGHDKGDIYIKKACMLICKVFEHSPVFRVGGDEFAVVLQNEDYQRRSELTELFEKAADEICTTAENKWEQASVTLGMAEYDPKSDVSVDEVIRHADKTMYEKKRERKERFSV